MAKITFGAMIADIRGKLRGDVFTIYRGQHIIRTHCANPANPQTVRQQFVRGFWSTVAGCWWGLPDSHQYLWEKFATLKSGLRTGIGAFMRMNMRLLSADHPELIAVSTPPHTPGTPEHVQGYGWSFVGASTARISWDAPQTSQTFVQMYHRLNWDYSPTYNIYWKHTKTVRSDCGQYDWVHPYPIGTDIHIKVKSMDRWGRQSPFTHRIKRVVT